MKPNQVFNFVQIVHGIISLDDSQKSFVKPVVCNRIVELKILPEIPNNLIGNSHFSHDDYLRVLSGKLIVLVLANKSMHYIPLNYESNKLLHIPKQTWHIVINIGTVDCIFQNWMRVWREPTQSDYKSIPVKFTFDLELATTALIQDQVQIVKI